MAQHGSLERLEMTQKARSRETLRSVARSGRCVDEDDDYGEGARFADHQLALVVEPCMQALMRAPGVKIVFIVALSNGAIIASSDPSSSIAAPFAVHVPALARQCSLVTRVLLDDEPAILQISTKKFEFLMMADRESGTAILVLQDRSGSQWGWLSDGVDWPDDAQLRTGRSGEF